jgi:hypothetical protein
MATFSQQFLSQLGNPAGMLQGAANLGGAIGGVPGQIKEKRVKQEDAAALARVKEDPEAWFNLLAQQAMRDGDRIKAADYRAKAIDAGRRATLITREDEAYRRKGQERDALKRTQISQTMNQLSRLQSLMSSDTATDEQKTAAQSLMKGIRSAGDGGGAAFADQVDLLLEGKSYDPERYKVAGNRILDLKTGKEVLLGDAGDSLKLSELRHVATPASLMKYIQSGDKSVLEPLAGKGGELSAKEAADLHQKYIKDGYNPKNVAEAIRPDGTIDVTKLGKKEEDGDKENTLRSDLLALDNVLDTVDKAFNLTDEYWVVGYDLTKFLPFPTDAKTMETYVNMVKSNLAFTRLQEMRDKSKTGGALGQVSNIELKLLESSVAQLDPGAGNFKEQLATVRRQYENFKNALLGLPPNDPKYTTMEGKLYYDRGNQIPRNMRYVDLEALAEQEDS